MYDPSLCTLPTYMHQFRLHTTCRKQLIEALSSFSFFSPQIPNMERASVVSARACVSKKTEMMSSPQVCHTTHNCQAPLKPKTPANPRVRVAETDTHRNDTHRMIDF